jgi:hypothetical protein
MLLVKTYLDKSSIHGIGLFAAEFIPAGTLVWEFTEEFDQKFWKSNCDRLGGPFLKFLKTYAYVDGDYVLCVDDARFMNHSSEPNTKNGHGENTIASRDIQIGEEITCDYKEIDDAADEKFETSKYGPLCSENCCTYSSETNRKLESCNTSGCVFTRSRYMVERCEQIYEDLQEMLTPRHYEKANEYLKMLIDDEKRNVSELKIAMVVTKSTFFHEHPLLKDTLIALKAKYLSKSVKN